MTQYNPAAPSYMHSYWGLEDNNPELKSVASSVMLNFICNMGKYRLDRVKALEEACKFAGFKTVEAVDKGKEVGFNVDDVESDLLKAFRIEVISINRGKYENEVVQVANIIVKYQPLTKKVHWKNSWMGKLFSKIGL